MHALGLVSYLLDADDVGFGYHVQAFILAYKDI